MEVSAKFAAAVHRMLAYSVRFEHCSVKVSQGGMCSWHCQGQIMHCTVLRAAFIVGRWLTVALGDPVERCARMPACNLVVDGTGLPECAYLVAP
jgi:hypothetical protein